MDMIDASTVGKWSMTEEKPRSTTPVQETPQKKISSSKLKRKWRNCKNLQKNLKKESINYMTNTQRVSYILQV
jgi:nicotinic acid mononucleotide adenylyltransferase